MYASPSARCHASSPSDRPAASGRKSYWVAGKTLNSFNVFSASRSHVSKNDSSSFIAMVLLLTFLLFLGALLRPFENGVPSAVHGGSNVRRKRADGVVMKFDQRTARRLAQTVLDV